MILSSHRGWIPGFAVALAGFAFCGVMALGLGKSLCFTEGCSLHQSVSLFGYSLWWWGAAAFAGLAGLTLIGRTRWAFVLSLLFLALDVLFLLWMALTATCVSCLGAAVFLALMPLALGATTPRGAKAAWAVLLLWGLSFTPNLFATARELQEPWALWGEESAKAELYFSPSCRACQMALFDVLRMGMAPRTRFYPLAKSEEDEMRIWRMVDDLAHNATLDETFEPLLNPIYEPVDSDAPGWWELKARLFLNRLAFTRAGGGSVPMMIIHGRPQFEQPQPND